MRVRSVLLKAISILVILLNLALVTFVWAVQDDLSNSAVTIFAGVDIVAQSLRNTIAIYKPEISNIQRLIGEVETTSEMISQNVSEAGIIPRFLPQTGLDSLTASSQSLRGNFIAVSGLLEATSIMLLALVTIPFVDIPEIGLSTIATLQDSMEKLSGQVGSLTSMISDTRSEAGARISRVTDAVVFLGNEAEQFQSDLIQIERDLDTIQISVRKYQRLTPPLILSTAILLSLLSAWVMYSQFNLIFQSESPIHEEINNRREQPEPNLDEGGHI